MSGRPLLVFDGDCGFCRLWIEYWRAGTGGAVEYAPYQSAAARHPEIPRESFAEAVHFFEPGRVSRGAEAAFRAYSRAPGWSWLPRAYALPGAAPVLEAGYRFVARRRVAFSRLTRLLWGESPVPPSLERTARLVLAALGLVYLCAFVSLAVQLRGLIGADGLMPAANLLAAAKAQLGAQRFWALPSLAWLSASDGALVSLCALGALASLGMVAGVAAGPCALACWVLYLSLCSVGSDFMSFQWDALLLEAGLVACLLPAWRRGGAASRGALWLLRLLLVKLMLQSGLVKLLSGDPSWRDLTALTYHYWTQPLPTPLAWWAARAPLWFQKLSCGVMFAVELGSPVLLLLPRRARFAGAGAVALLMLAIGATGNYGFFNPLTLALCLACLDDRLLGADARSGPPRAPSRAVAAYAAFWLLVSLSQTAALFGLRSPRPVLFAAAAVSPLRSFNSYGLFAVMTKSRDEVAVEVSADGHDWREWPFKYKAGDPGRAPPWVAPHMPRLDWQMWFAALGGEGDSPWLGNLLYRVLQGKPDALALLGPSPLGAQVPRFARAVRWQTRFTTADERRADGAWWARARGSLFTPVVALKRY